MVKQKNDPLRLVWIDLEMTGLDPDKHVILEIATLITDGDLQLLAEGPSLAISRESDDLDQMNSWNVTTHTGSGLIERVTSSEITVSDAEQMTLSFLEQWVGKGTAPLAGNSIGQDRLFLRNEMPAANEYLHYRNVDVSTLKELARRWYPDNPEFKKKNTHRALDDIRESIAELRYYRNTVLR